MGPWLLPGESNTPESWKKAEMRFDLTGLVPDTEVLPRVEAAFAQAAWMNTLLAGAGVTGAEQRTGEN